MRETCGRQGILVDLFVCLFVCLYASVTPGRTKINQFGKKEEKVKIKKKNRNIFGSVVAVDGKGGLELLSFLFVVLIVFYVFCLFSFLRGRRGLPRIYR